MTVQEIFNYFINLADFVTWENRADHVWLGDPHRQVSRIGTGWSACMGNLKAAAADGCDLFIAHEAPFGMFPAPEGDRREAIRLAFLRESGMALINLHDAWDHFPDVGVRPAFARCLGLGEMVRELDYIHPGTRPPAVTTGGGSIGVYKTRGQTFYDFALGIANSLSPFGCRGVSATGDLTAVINTAAIGVGCHIPTFEAMDAGADALVVVYDRALLQPVRINLADNGANVVVIEHSYAEMPAMRDMAEYIGRKLHIAARYYANEPECVPILAGKGMSG